MSEALFVAITRGELATVSSLLNDGANANYRQPSEGRPFESRITCLMNASLEGHLELVRRLLDYGAEVDARDIDGRTALMFAVQRWAEPIVRLLIERGADVNLSWGNKRRSAHSIATFRLNYLQKFNETADEERRKANSILKLLEEAGASSDITDKSELFGSGAKLLTFDQAVSGRDGLCKDVTFKSHVTVSLGDYLLIRGYWWCKCQQMISFCIEFNGTVSGESALCPRCQERGRLSVTDGAYKFADGFSVCCVPDWYEMSRAEAATFTIDEVRLMDVRARRKEDEKDRQWVTDRQQRETEVKCVAEIRKHQAEDRERERREKEGREEREYREWKLKEESDERARVARIPMIKQERKDLGLCVLCGRVLGMFDRIRKREKHARCSTFREY